MSDFIPVARFADMLLQSRRAASPTTAATHAIPTSSLVYWAGGNPFHHHQDLNRLRLAWRKPETDRCSTSSSGRRPRAMADIVLPATTSLERDDIGYGSTRALPDRHEEGARAGRRGARRLRDLRRARQAAGRRRRLTPRAATPWRGCRISMRRSRAKSAEAGVDHAAVRGVLAGRHRRGRAARTASSR